VTASEPWPNLFLAGVPKAGTTSLHRYLDQHPDVHMSSEKETYFFNRVWDELGDDEEALAREREDYLALFEDAGSARVRGESTPGYFAHPEAVHRIHDTVPEARAVVSLRDPVERAFSEYLMNRREGVWERPLAEMVEHELEAGPENRTDGLLWTGFYARHLERWQATLGGDRVHVLLLDELEEDPHAVLRGIARFLEIDPEPMDAVDTETRHNPYRVPRGPLAGWLLDSEAVRRAARALVPEPVRIALGERVLSKRPEKPTMDPDVRHRLEELYRPEVERLAEALDREPPWLATWGA
jgi:hypothetical protein